MNGSEATRRLLKIIDFCYKESKSQDARSAKTFARSIEREANHRYLTMVISFQSFFTAHHNDICSLSLAFLRGRKEKIMYLDKDEIDDKENKVYINISDLYERIESRDHSNKELDVKDVEKESKLDYFEKTIAYLYYFTADEREQKVINRALGNDAVTQVEQKASGAMKGIPDHLRGIMNNPTLQNMMKQVKKSVPNAQEALKNPTEAIRKVVANPEIRQTIRGAAGAFGVDSDKMDQVERTIDKVAQSDAMEKLKGITGKIIPNGDVSNVSLQNLDMKELGNLAQDTMKEITGKDSVADLVSEASQDSTIGSLLQKARETLPQELLRKGGDFLEGLASRVEERSDQRLRASASEAGTSGMTEK